MFTKRLKALRQERSVLQKDVAIALGVSRQVYNNYELGKREPDFKTVTTLADYFGVSVDYLLGKSDIPNPSVISVAIEPLNVDDVLNNLGIKNPVFLDGLKKLIINQAMIENNESLSEDFDASDYSAKLKGGLI